MNFGDTLQLLREGNAVRRPGWQGLPTDTSRPYIHLTHPEGFDEMITVSYPGREIQRPFAGAQWDLLADDWEIVVDVDGLG
jgi:hypothetical protein